MESGNFLTQSANPDSVKKKWGTVFFYLDPLSLTVLKHGTKRMKQKSWERTRFRRIGCEGAGQSMGNELAAVRCSPG